MERYEEPNMQVVTLLGADVICESVPPIPGANVTDGDELGL